ncbi:type III secretion system chaperone [Pseudochelatococcus sp. B33]
MADQALSPGNVHGADGRDAVVAGAAEVAHGPAVHEPAPHRPASHAPVHHAPQGASRTAVALLADFGRLVGLPSLYFGDDDCCWLDIGAEHIACIATLGDGGFLRLHGEVAELPAERDSPDLSGYFRRLLAQNAAAVRRGDALPFAIDPRRNALVLTDTVPVKATGQQLRDAMETLVEQMTALKRNPPPVDGEQAGNRPEGDTPEPAAEDGGLNGPAQETGLLHNGVARPTHLTAPPPAVTGELVWRV